MIRWSVSLRLLHSPSDQNHILNNKVTDLWLLQYDLSLGVNRPLGNFTSAGFRKDGEPGPKKSKE